MPSTLTLPTQTELLLPLLNVLRENGQMRAKDACDAVAEKIGLPAATRRHVEEVGPCGQEANLFDRKVRWLSGAPKRRALLVDRSGPAGVVGTDS